MQESKSVLIVPLAFDLDRDDAGNVVLGAGTKLACDHAMRIAREHWDRGDIVTILTTATHAGPQFDGALMGKLMRDYIWGAYRAELPFVPALVVFSEAGEFNTIGEVVAAAAFLEKRSLDEVVFVVKRWHLRRVKMIALKVFAARRIQTYPVFRTHDHRASPAVLIHEWLGLFPNWLKLRKLLKPA